MIGLHSPVATASKLGVTLALASLVYLQPYRIMVLDGSSMAPTYLNHSILLTEPVRQDRLTKGMVVQIDLDSGPIVKRIAFMPGDKIRQMKIAGAWCDMVMVHPIDRQSTARLETRTYTIPPGFVYVLGDNLTVSCDSRQLGLIPMSRIKHAPIDQRVFHRYAGIAPVYMQPHPGKPSSGNELPVEP